MMIVTHGVVLARKPFREFDRVAMLYTRDLGKLRVRFIGVDRPAGKLKALAEPMVHAEYRLAMRPGAAHAVATGGAIVSSYPGVRGDFEATLAGLEMCECLMRLVPEGAPSPEKFDLMVEHLQALELAPSRWTSVAFAWRLLELSGWGLPQEPCNFAQLRWRVEQAIERHIERPLNSRSFRRSLEQAVSDQRRSHAGVGQAQPVYP